MLFSPGRNERGKQSLLTDLKDLPSTENLDTFVADVSDPKSVEALGEAVKAKYGAVDHVVTSVGGWWQKVGHIMCALLV
jgi:NAD(P)-dependent dehydrogenase (short-subunit alcohol dehydrogenase family)